MKKIYVCPIAEVNRIELNQFICTSPNSNRIIDGPEGPTGPVSDDDDTPTDDDALGKGNTLWDSWE